MHQKLILKTLLLLGLSVALLACNSEKTFYVSAQGSDSDGGSKTEPWASPEAALRGVQHWMSNHPGENVRVVFSEGMYSLNETLVFASDFFGNPERQCTWEAADGDRVILSGGVRLSGWQVSGDGRWSLTLPQGLDFEQLYIDDQRATRARHPNAGNATPRFYIQSTEVFRNEPGKDLSKMILHTTLVKSAEPLVENCEVVIYKDWATLRHGVLSYNPAEASILLKPPFAFFEGNYNSLFAPYVSRFSGYLEGSPAFIDQPGEWAIDPTNRVLWYLPLPGQKPDSVEVVAPRLETLVKIAGTREKPVQNIGFRGIRFAHAAYQLPAFGHDGRQACFYYSEGTGMSAIDAIIPSTIYLQWAENCLFEACTVNLTGANGITMAEGSHDNRILNGKIAHFGGNGIMIGMARDPQRDSVALPCGNEVSGCSISDGGKHFESGVGLWIGFARNILVADNELFNLPYTGISVGWQWNPLPSSSRDNQILNNEIHDVMQVLGDGGGIYTLGFQPGSVIRGNQIWNVLRSEMNHASPNNGMFIDEGSKGYLIENNTIRRTAHTAIRGHRAAGVTLKNNTFNYEDLPAVSHTPPYEAMIFVNKDTTVTWPNPGWPAEWGYGDIVEAFYMEGNRFVKSR